MHNKRIGRDDILKIEVSISPLLSQNSTMIIVKCLTRVLVQQWARTPPSASWRFDSGRDRDRRRSPPRRRSPSPRRGRGDYSPRKDDRRSDRDRDYDRDRRDTRDRSRSPDHRYASVQSTCLPNVNLFGILVTNY